MNKIILMGRLTRDPEVTYGGSTGGAIARFSIAVDRRFKKEGQPTADFFNCTAFGKTGEFVEKWLHKGTKVVLDGEMQQNDYTNKEGQKVRDFRVIVNQIEFAESKKADSSRDYNGGGGYDGGGSYGGGGGYGSSQAGPAPTEDPGEDNFMNIPGDMEEDLPFA